MHHVELSFLDPNLAKEIGGAPPPITKKREPSPNPGSATAMHYPDHHIK